MFDFIALDFETANRKHAPCSAGVVFVKGGNVEFSDYTLINPEVPFDKANIRIHGITPEQVENAPTWPQFFEKFYPLMRHYPIVAHNASVERNVIEKNCIRYGLPIPYTAFYDTLNLFKRNFPNLERYSLDFLCDALHIDLEHHNALSDATACAKLLYILQRDEGYNLAPSEIIGYYTPVSTCHAAPEKPKSTEKRLVMPNLNYCEQPIHIPGNTFVITGDVEGHSRQEIEAEIEKIGGTAKSSVGKKLNYLAVGMLDISVITDKEGCKSRKILDAEMLQQQGFGVQIVRLSDLVNVLFKE